MCAVFETLGAIPQPIWSSIISALASISAAFVAASMIIYQIKKQLNNALTQTRTNEAIKLKRDVYKEVVDVADTVQTAEMDIFSYSHKFIFGLTAAESSLQFFGKIKVPDVCTDDLIEKHYALAKRISSFIGFVERWTIVDTRLIVFQFAINAAKFDLDRQYEKYFDVALKTMPRKLQPSLGSPSANSGWQLPTSELRKSLETESAKYQSSLLAMGGVVHDFKIEMQNLLLSELFENQVPHRTPIDPRIKVIRLSDHKSLIEHFENNTAWGHNKRAAEERARASL